MLPAEFMVHAFQFTAAYCQFPGDLLLFRNIVSNR